MSEYKYAAVFSGASYAPGYIGDPTQVELYTSIQDAADSLWERAYMGHHRPIFTVNGYGESNSTLWPTVGTGDSLTLYRLPPGVEPSDWLTTERDPYPDYVLTIGPRGGIKRERV